VLVKAYCVGGWTMEYNKGSIVGPMEGWTKQVAQLGKWAA
jgi:hypothetical protein